MLRDHLINITPLKNLTERQAKDLPYFEFESYCVCCVVGIPLRKQMVSLVQRTNFKKKL